MQRIDCEQGTEEWLKARIGIPTASEFGKIITPKTGKLSASADGYIADLIVEQVEEPDELFRSYWMDRGIETEPEAANWYAFQYDVDLKKAGIILNHGAGYSPDRLVGGGAIEIKCPKPSTHVKWLLADGLPDEHRPQCHAALHIGELDWIDFVSYCLGYRPLVVRVYPDDYTEKLAAALVEFLERYDDAKKRVFGS